VTHPAAEHRPRGRIYSGSMPAKRVLISIDERLLARIDERTSVLGLTRSRYLAQLAASDLAGGNGTGVDPTVLAALHAIDALFDEASQA
jgi:hypothetical protein